MRFVYTYGLLRIISSEVWKSECGEAGNPLQRQILYCYVSVVEDVDCRYLV